MVNKKILAVIFFALTILNIFLASWYVLHKDIYFSSDIARDFLLLQELDQKKLVLIGPRSSVQGLFHGPLWMYLNYPAYKIGHGNPVTVGWYWIFLEICALTAFYFLAKKLFDQFTAYLFVLMTSLYFVFIANGLFNPHGAMLLLPIFFYFFVRYIQMKEVKNLAISVLLAGCLIQFQMAVGIPIFVLSLLYTVPFTIRNKQVKHLLVFFLILIPLSTFILFDLKHNFLMLHNAFRHVGTKDAKQTIFSLVQNRFTILVSGTEFLRYGIGNGSLYVSLIFFVFLFIQIVNKKHLIIYQTFLYFYVGFFALSLINKYDLLYFYIFPLFPFVFLIFSSFITSRYKQLFFLIFSAVYITNLVGAVVQDQDAVNVIGKTETSWQALLNVAKTPFATGEKSFGYFVYSPDVLGYGPKYAMEYAKNQYPQVTTYSFEKKPITFLLSAPPPRNNPNMNDNYWTTKQLGIKSKPLTVTKFPNGYRVEKYALSKEEQSISFDPAINPGLHFR